MRRLNAFIAVIGVAALAAGALIYASLAATPAIEATALDPDDVRALRVVLSEQIQRDGRGELGLGSDDADRLLRWALQQRGANRDWRAHLELRGEQAHLQLSRPVSLPVQSWLNIRLVLIMIDGSPLIQDAAIGRLSLPRTWLGWWLRSRWQTLREQSPQAWGSIEQLWIADSRLRVRYQLDAEDGALLQQQSAAAWFGPDIETRLRSYQEILADRQRWPERHPPLTAVLQTLMQEAAQSGGDPATEHTALLLALAQQESSPAMAALLRLGRRSSDQWLQPKLHGRRDLAQHFVLAGALTLYAGDAVANQLGLLKEMEDRDGNGLDAADLLANQAGIRFAEAVTSAGKSAQLQQQLAAGIDDRAIMPSPRELPQSLHDELERLMNGDEHIVRHYLDEVFNPMLDRLPALHVGDMR